MIGAVQTGLFSSYLQQQTQFVVIDTVRPGIIFFLLVAAVTICSMIGAVRTGLFSSYLQQQSQCVVLDAVLIAMFSYF